MYFSTALKREAHSRGCRCTKSEEKSSEKPLRSSLDFWITFYEDLGPFLRAFGAHFAPQNARKNEPKNRSDFGGSLGGPLWIRFGEGGPSWRQGGGRGRVGKGIHPLPRIMVGPTKGRREGGRWTPSKRLAHGTWAGGLSLYLIMNYLYNSLYLWGSPPIMK